MHIVNYLLVMTISLFTFKAESTTCQKPIRIQFLESEKDHLIHSLLKLTLSKVNQDNCIVTYNTVLTSSREQLHVQKDLLDIFWTSNDLNNTLIPIRFPIFRGLLGYRVLVIRQNEQHRFEQIKTLHDLKIFTAGLGKDWGDKEVLKNQALPIVTSNKGRHLWPMLAKKRFDYIPLGINEPWADLALRADLKLTVEKKILLHYPIDLYFHVNKKNTQLAKYLRKGMRIALDDGSYDALLQKSNMVQATLNNANVASRKTIALSNFNFSRYIPDDNLKYWLSPKQLLTFLDQAQKYK